METEVRSGISSGVEDNQSEPMALQAHKPTRDADWDDVNPRTQERTLSLRVAHTELALSARASYWARRLGPQLACARGLVPGPPASTA